MNLPKACLACGRLTRHGSRCTTCTRERRGTTTTRGYGAAWQATARQVIATHGRCVRCGATYDLTVDHVVPKARGGTDASDNLQVLCRTCNGAKDSLTRRHP